MNTSCSKKRNQGLTFLEAVVVILSLILLAALLLPALSAPRSKRHVSCANQLKQVAVAFRNWQGDNGDKFPNEVSVAKGGAMELALRGDALSVFQVLSNELGTPKFLYCPADVDRHEATNFALTSKNVSYFVNVDADPTLPQGILAGDDNLEVNHLRVKPGLVEMDSHTTMAWLPTRHRLCGNVVIMDGSVQAVNNLMITNYFCPTNGSRIRLAIP